MKPEESLFADANAPIHHFPMINPIRTLLLSCLVICSLVGCAVPQNVAEEKDANGNKIEYVYYTPTGSNIPVRVRKDQIQSDEKRTKQDQDTLRKIQMMGVVTPKVMGVVTPKGN